jgi:hypothetical protein
MRRNVVFFVLCAIFLLFALILLLSAFGLLQVTAEDLNASSNVGALDLIGAMSAFGVVFILYCGAALTSLVSDLFAVLSIVFGRRRCRIASALAIGVNAVLIFPVPLLFGFL